MSDLYEVLAECSGFYFFQAEDGIRDIGVTGVQTCALPISQQTLEQFFRLCDAAGQRCAFGPDSAARYAALAARLRAEPLEIVFPDGTTALYRDRKSVVLGKRGDLGGRRIIKKKNTHPLPII